MDISDERLQKALKYLATTDAEAARAKALSEGLNEQRKTIKAMLFMEAPSGTVPAKENWAYAHEEYTTHLDKMKQAMQEHETLKNKRLTEQLIVEVWRSCNANRRQGNI